MGVKLHLPHGLSQDHGAPSWIRTWQWGKQLPGLTQPSFSLCVLQWGSVPSFGCRPYPYWSWPQGYKSFHPIFWPVSSSILVWGEVQLCFSLLPSKSRQFGKESFSWSLWLLSIPRNAIVLCAVFHVTLHSGSSTCYCFLFSGLPGPMLDRSNKSRWTEQYKQTEKEGNSLTPSASDFLRSCNFKPRFSFTLSAVSQS